MWIEGPKGLWTDKSERLPYLLSSGQFTREEYARRANAQAQQQYEMIVNSRKLNVTNDGTLMSEDLKPCHKCDWEEPKVDSSRHMQLSQVYCGICGYTLQLELCEEDVIEKWNELYVQGEK